MTKIKIEIKNRWTGSILFTYEKDGNTIKDTLTEAIKSKADLSGADLSWADLSGADLSKANLSGADLSKADLSGADLSKANLSKANLSKADLSGADLSGADLSWADLSKADLSKADLSGADLSKADLSGADLSWADLSKADLSKADLSGADLDVFKNDLFVVLLHSVPEVQYLRQSIIDGKIDGSTYDGECACLSGTLANAAKAQNGPDESIINQRIMNCRNSGRPIERLFLAIKIGDAPENSALCKIIIGWIEEFILLTSFYK